MSNFGQLIFDLPSGTKKLIRTIERTNRKLAKAYNSLVFNETCLKEDILPNYTNIYIYIYIYVRTYNYMINVFDYVCVYHVLVYV